LDAAQGAGEERNEPYYRYGEVSTGVSNTAMRQVQSRSVVFLNIMLAFLPTPMYCKFSESYKNKHTLQKQKCRKVQKYVVTDRSTTTTTTENTLTISGCFHLDMN
jgi:hypothetical protein